MNGLNVIILSIVLFACAGTIIMSLNRVSDKNKRLLVCIFAVLLGVIIPGLRDKSFDNDTYNYANIFIEINNQSYSSRLAAIGKGNGYDILCRFVGLFSNDPQVMIFFSALITYIGIAVFIYHTSENVMLSWLYFIGLGHMFTTMNIARQMIAVMLMMNSFLMITKGKTKQALMLGVIAFLIHKVSLVFVVIYIVSFYLRRYNSYRALVLVIVGMICVSLLSMPIIGFIVNRFLPAYRWYFNKAGGLNYFRADVALRVISYVGFDLILLLFALNEHKNATRNINMDSSETLFERNYLNNMYICAICFASLLSYTYPFDINVMRLEFYFAILIVSFIPRYIYSYSKRNTRLALVVLSLIGSAIVFYFRIGASEQAFKFFWQT
jgi:hypothetical protein